MERLKVKALPLGRLTVRQYILCTLTYVISFEAVEAGPDRAMAKVDTHIIWRPTWGANLT